MPQKILELIKSFTIAADEMKQLAADLVETGKGSAQISLIGVKDHDDDIAAPGSFGVGQWAHVLPTHNWGSVPLGKALIREEGDKVFADFQMNLAIQKAVDWANALAFDLKVGAPIQEWSYGLRVKVWEVIQDDDGDRVRLMKEIEVFEVSPVVRGAGSDTGTVDIKGHKGNQHTTATSAAPWSTSDNAKNIAEEPDVKSLYATDDSKFLHHFVDVDGQAREASIKACQNGIEVINGERGGVTVPDDQKQAAYDHLAKHLKDAGIEAPALNLKANSGLKLADEMETFIQNAHDLKDRHDALVQRLTDLKTRRGDAGRTLSASMIEDVNQVQAVVTGLKGLEIVTDPSEEKEANELATNLLAGHLIEMHKKNLPASA